MFISARYAEQFSRKENIHSALWSSLGLCSDHLIQDGYQEKVLNPIYEYKQPEFSNSCYMTICHSILFSEMRSYNIFLNCLIPLYLGRFSCSLAFPYFRWKTWLLLITFKGSSLTCHSFTGQLQMSLCLSYSVYMHFRLSIICSAQHCICWKGDTIFGKYMLLWQKILSPS